jgi:acetyl-CoA carboxylase biotin carboxyl carrier protein
VTADPAGPPQGAAHELDDVRRNVVELLAGFPGRVRALRVQAGGVSLEIEWDADSPAVPLPAASGVPDDEVLTAPAVGVFYRAPEPGAKPFAEVGDVIRAGQQIGIIEAMKLMIPVEADRPCRIVAIVAGDGTPVEFGDPLYSVREEGAA